MPLKLPNILPYGVCAPQGAFRQIIRFVKTLIRCICHCLSFFLSLILQVVLCPLSHNTADNVLAPTNTLLVDIRFNFVIG